MEITGLRILDGNHHIEKKFLINVDAVTNVRIGAHVMGIIIRNSTCEVICARAIHWPFPILDEAAEAHYKKKSL